jgi:methylated-DNA-[protein]-cysteine S-methyltransferase
MTAIIQTIDTPDGPFTMLVDADDRVLASGWTRDADAILARLHPSNRPAEFSRGEVAAASAVMKFYSGDVHAINDVAVRNFGTDFQRLGWQVLRDITPGEPLSYTEFAVRLGRPTATRAAASICARNAPALFVPCHRVLRQDGSMGGFAWGEAVKRSLLVREAESMT